MRIFFKKVRQKSEKGEKSEDKEKGEKKWEKKWNQLIYIMYIEYDLILLVFQYFNKTQT